MKTKRPIILVILLFAVSLTSILISCKPEVSAGLSSKMAKVLNDDPPTVGLKEIANDSKLPEDEYGTTADKVVETLNLYRESINTGAVRNLSDVDAFTATGALNYLNTKIGIPTGGAINQIIVKKSLEDGDVEWKDNAGGGVPAGGLIHQVLTKKSNDDGDADWENNNPTAPKGYGCITLASGGMFIEAEYPNDEIQFIGTPINVIAISGNNESHNKSITFTVNIPELYNQLEAERLKRSKGEK